MAIYSSDIEPILMRAVEALDRNKSITFADLWQRVADGDLRCVVEQAGHYPGLELIPDEAWIEINEAVRDVWGGSLRDEPEHFYVGKNGYCLLIALLRQVEKFNALGPQRPLAGPGNDVVRPPC